MIFSKRLYLFIFRGEGRERNINVWFPLACPLPGTWPATQACALTGNRTSNPLVHRPALNPLSYTSRADDIIFEFSFDDDKDGVTKYLL